MRIAGIVILAIVVGACRTAAVGQAPPTLVVSPLFGPVIGPEVISGRVIDRGVLLLAGGLDLVRIDLERRTADRRPLRLGLGDSCWGLARLDSGELWTLKGRRTLARIDREGAVVEQIALAAPHFGVFAAGNRLVYQEAVFTAPAPALKAGTADGTSRRPWSDMMTRPFARLARASSAALNMVSCGTSAGAEIPCWFPDEAAIFLIDPEGRTRRVTLAGLQTVPPETLLTSDNPARPVRDAHVDATGDLWILSSGTAPTSADSVGGWVLARYTHDGHARGLSRLSEPARLILTSNGGLLTMMLASGKVGEIARW